MKEELFIGMDVSLDRLDVAVFGDTRAYCFENGMKGIDALCKKCKKWKPALVVLKATGGLEHVDLTNFFKKEFQLYELTRGKLKILPKQLVNLQKQIG